ncbi:MAG: hypothetical protein M1365_08930 [Actinobacteria bacterium]|nr:hypothetical protein [Actinomycetota bacterium]
MEKGLICVYPDPNSQQLFFNYDELSCRKIRVVSNGKEGRVYPIEDDSETSDKIG